MAKIDTKFKAVTLMESMVAMIIIVVCFGIATLTISNVMGTDKYRQKLKAMLMLNEEAKQVKAEKSFIDSEKQFGDWTITRAINKYAQSENLYQLTLSAKDKDGKTIAIRNELIATE